MSRMRNKAADFASVNLTGDKELDATLRALGRRVEGRAQRQAMAAGGRIIRKAARANLPRGKYRRLRKSIAVKVERRESGWLARIGPTKDGGWLGHIVEFGTGPRYTKKGAYRGIFRARPFLRPAYDTHLSAAQRKIAEVIEKAIAREVEKRRSW